MKAPSTGAFARESLTRNWKGRPAFHSETAMKTPSQFEVWGAPMITTFGGRGSQTSFHRETARYAVATALFSPMFTPGQVMVRAPLYEAGASARARAWGGRSARRGAPARTRPGLRGRGRQSIWSTP